jgi:peroxiredoxin Q/BCP
MLAIGDRAPDFTLPDQDNRATSLDDLLAKGPLLLYFYPADFTPVCTREACAFGALESELAAKGVTLAGVSPQDSLTHTKFRARYHLPFPLLADPERRVIRAYDCDAFWGLHVSRVTYRIGTDKRILDATKAAFQVAPHLALARKALDG